MILGIKGLSAKTQTRPSKAKPDAYTKLVKTRSTETLDLKAEKSGKLLRFRKKTNSMLSYLVSEKNSAKSCKSKNNKKDLKAQKTSPGLSKASKASKSSLSFGKNNNARPISSLFSQSRPLFVEPSPAVLAQALSVAASPGTPGNEGYKFPLLRNKQSQSFSLSLCPDSSQVMRSLPKVSMISGTASSKINTLQSYPSFCSNILNSPDFYSFYSSGQQVSPKDYRHNSLPFINSQ